MTKSIYLCLFLPTKKVKVRYIVVKGHSVFVYRNQESPAPKYAIDLAHMTIFSQRNVVYIESALGDVEYKFKFDTRQNPLLPSEFMAALQQDAELANTDEIKKVGCVCVEGGGVFCFFLYWKWW